MRKAETAAHSPGDGALLHPQLQELQQIREHKAPQGGWCHCLVSQISLAQRFFIFSQLLPAPTYSLLAITVDASPSNCSSEMHHLDFPATKNCLTERSLVIPAFLFLFPLTPKPFTAHISFSGSPPACQLC